MYAIFESLRQWLNRHTPHISHQAVVRDIGAEVEITPGYFLALNIANLIALCGLLLGSSPVIIGAMLISPLMGPILSVGFAFVTGDETIWRKAIRKILISVTLSILVAALATFLSPLQEVTGEILARTRPNLYDLIIAFLAGIVGAGALCTKKSAMTIVPGVAIATAVIPPLSVTGFGLATLDITILSGGFLLFFTNFVAIILATCAVFYYYGFRRQMSGEVELSQMKKRFTFLIAVLILISIPLALTLKNSLSEIRLNSAIGAALRQELEQEKRSHLVAFTYAERDDGTLAIGVNLNTVRYLSEEEVGEVEKLVGRGLARAVVLNVEQVLVKAGGLRPGAADSAATPASPATPAETIAGLRDSLRSLVQKSVRRIERVIAPETVPSFTVAIDSTTERIAVHLTLRRDAPLSTGEVNWLQGMLAEDLGKDVTLTVEQQPFVPPLSFADGESELSEAMKAALAPLGTIYRQSRAAAVSIEATSGQAGVAARKLAGQRLRLVTALLVTEGQIPAERIDSRIVTTRDGAPTVRVTLQEDVAQRVR